MTPLPGPSGRDPVRVPDTPRDVPAPWTTRPRHTTPVHEAQPRVTTDDSTGEGPRGSPRPGVWTGPEWNGSVTENGSNQRSPTILVNWNWWYNDGVLRVYESYAGYIPSNPAGRLSFCRVRGCASQRSGACYRNILSKARKGKYGAATPPVPVPPRLSGPPTPLSTAGPPYLPHHTHTHTQTHTHTSRGCSRPSASWRRIPVPSVPRPRPRCGGASGVYLSTADL